MLNKTISFLLKLLKKEESSSRQKLEYNQVMKIAKQIHSENPEALNDLIKLLARPYQSITMKSVLTELDQNSIKTIDSKELFFDQFEKIPYLNQSLFDLKEKCNYSKPLKLKTDVILPWPWNQYRIINCLSNIGIDRPAGNWKQDDNHKIEYWLPFGIGFVHGGNHSITNGIINGTGVIKKYDTYDISKIYKFIYCDGEYYRIKKDNTIFQKVNNLEFACIFEIGRLMLKSNKTLDDE